MGSLMARICTHDLASIPTRIDNGDIYLDVLVRATSLFAKCILRICLPSQASREEYTMSDGTRSASDLPPFGGGEGKSEEDAVVINAPTDFAGVGAEYAWLSSRFGKRGTDWERTLQMLAHGQDGHRVFDVLFIRLADGTTRKIWFDITRFYGDLPFAMRAHGRQVVVVKRLGERFEHVLMKAFLWALYLPTYPDLAVEVPVGDRYQPDVVSLDERGLARFWGEAGEVSKAQIRHLICRYPSTHLAIAKWDVDLAPLISLVSDALATRTRTAPVDLLCFPPDSAERFLDKDEVIHIALSDIEWIRLP